jgi:hypothetical protein
MKYENDEKMSHMKLKAFKMLVKQSDLNRIEKKSMQASINFCLIIWISSHVY